MDGIHDLLQSRAPQEPPQVAALRQYMSEHYNTDVAIRTQRTHYTLRVPNASLAQRVRIDSLKIIAACELDRKLVIHIGTR